MALSAFVPGGAPVLSNSIPFIDHPLFAAGMVNTVIFQGQADVLLTSYNKGRSGWGFVLSASIRGRLL